MWKFLLFFLLFAINYQISAQTIQYRSDQFRPGVISEYIEVEFLDSGGGFIKGKYWSIYRSGFETYSTEKEEIMFRQVKKYDGEEVGIEGQLKLSINENWLIFRIAEGVFEIEHSDTNFQIFEKEE
jgi:hypothetical protein